MARSAGGELLGTLSHGDDVPLYRRVYTRIRGLILDGTIARGAKLPSSRALADDLGVSRNTVLLAFDLLRSEGYVSGRVGAGTYVACRIPDDLERPCRIEPNRARVKPPTRRLSAVGSQLSTVQLGRDPMEVRPFVVGMPAVAEFPWSLWRRLWTRASRSVGDAQLAYGDPLGYEPLRHAVAKYLSTARGVRCSPDHVLILSSAQQALDLAARILIDPGDPVWIEEPGYLGARGAFNVAGADLVPVPVDGHGLIVDHGVAKRPDARVAYVTPSHQFPLGSIMSLERRVALLDWAASHDAWIIEDDYDSEYRYVGHPLTALQGLDRDDRVIYIGTFAKVIFPSLRLAYVVPPPDLVDAFVAARTFQDRHAPTLPQAVLTEFFERGHFPAHLRRMRAMYRERQLTLTRRLRECIPDIVTVGEDPAGMHLVAELPSDVDDGAVRRLMQEHGFSASPLSRYYLGRSKRQGLLLGYAALSCAEIEEAVDRLSEVLRHAVRSSGSKVSKYGGSRARRA